MDGCTSMSARVSAVIVTGAMLIIFTAIGASASAMLNDSEIGAVRGGCSRSDCVPNGKCNRGSVDCSKDENQSASCYRCATSITGSEPEHERCDDDEYGTYAHCKTSLFMTGCNDKTYGLCQLHVCNIAGQEPSDNGCGLHAYGPQARQGCDTDPRH